MQYYGNTVTKTSRCLKYIRDKGTSSRVELAEILSINKKTVSLVIDELLQCGLIKSSGYKKSTAGRRQELLSINGNHSNYIGLDLGATHITGILADLNGDIQDLIFFEIRPGLSAELILNQLATITQQLLNSNKSTAEVLAIGVSLPGFINPETGDSYMAENIPGWKKVNIRDMFKSKFDIPVYIDDCSRALGLAEKYFGKGKEIEDFIVLDLGYGIGMAIFIKGELYSGSRYKSGEIGHTVIDPFGLQCSCGKRGCLETVASGKGIADQAFTGMKEGRSNLLMELTQNQEKKVTAQDVSLAASMKDEFSLELIQSAGRYIGIALSNALNLLNPRSVIIGGGLIGAGDILLESIKLTVKQYTMTGIVDDVEIFLSEIGKNGSALGSALLSMSQTFSPNTFTSA